MVKMFEKLPLGVPLKFSDIMEAENKILKAIKHSSLREWLTTVGCHHTDSYRHCLFVTGFAVAFAQHLGMREDDQRRLTRAALLHDVGKAFVPVAILDKPGTADTERKWTRCASIRAAAIDALAAQGGFPPEMLDVVLHHHEFLDGSGYPDGLSGNQISDIVRLTTIVDIYAALVEKRAYRMPFTHAKAFAMMEEMGDKLDQQLLQAFRPMALGIVLSRSRSDCRLRSITRHGLRARADARPGARNDEPTYSRQLTPASSAAPPSPPSPASSAACRRRSGSRAAP